MEDQTWTVEYRYRMNRGTGPWTGWNRKPNHDRKTRAAAESLANVLRSVGGSVRVVRVR